MASRLPVTTAIGHVQRAISFANLQNMYFAIGKPTAWTYTNSEGVEVKEGDKGFSVPLPNSSTTDLDELICMKAVDVKSLCVEDPEGTIAYKDTTWKTITESEARDLGAHWVYVEATIKFSDIKVTQYREIGLYSGVVANSDVSDTNLLLPTQIDSTGILEVVDYRAVVTRDEDSRDTFSMILEL